MLTLGGFIQGGTVIPWALVCPLGALLFDQPRVAPHWFPAFAGLLVLSGFLEFQLDFTSHMGLELGVFFFVIRITRNTYDLIKDDFICQRRGVVAMKGAGQTGAWFVTGAKST